MRVKLADVCERGSSNLKQADIPGKSGDYPVYGASGYIGNVDFYQQKKPYVAVVKDGAGIGRAMLLPAESSVIGTMQYLLPKSVVLPEYLFYVVKHMHLEKYFSGATIPHIYFRDYQNEEFTLDDLNKQHEVVTTLRKVESVIENRQQQLQKLDELVKARFVEMFGDMKPTVTIERYIAELRGGKSLAGTEECKNKVLKTGAATFGWFDPEQYKYLPVDYEPLPEHKVETGDVIISRMNTPELVGACSYVFEAPEGMYYPDRLWKVIPQTETNPIFLWQLLWDREIRRQIKEKSGGTSGTMHNISKPKLLEIKCIDAPIELQNQFADFVRQIDKSKF